jgi:isopenicillin-N epimerase
MNERGIDTLVDGAHCVGHIDLDIPAIGATWYTSNCHKWICAPKGSAFMWVRRDRQMGVRPAVISHAANSNRTDRSRYLQEFDWMGTVDPTPFLCIPASIEFVQGLLPGGLPALWERNYKLCLEGRDLLCEALGCEAPAPDSMLGCLAAVPLPDGDPTPPKSALYTDPLQDALLRRGVEVPIVPFPGKGKRLVRISAQAYNHREQYVRLAAALKDLL